MGEFGGFCSSVSQRSEKEGKEERERELCVQVKTDKEEDNGSVVIFIE